MRKLYFLLLSVLVTAVSFAQINQGGSPASLELDIDNSFQRMTLSALDNEVLLNEQIHNAKDGGIDQVAVFRNTNYTMQNTGTREVLENGDEIWRLQITSPNSYGAKLIYDNFRLAEGATFFVYSPNYAEIKGAFTSFNNHETGKFTTSVIKGPTIILEVYEPANVAGSSTLTVEGFAHFYKSNGLGLELPQGFGDSQSCEVNINCTPEGNSWQDEKRGVARIGVVSTNNFGQTVFGWCSGSLVNNTNQDCTPYFLTAYHCGDGTTNNQFLQWDFDFNYEASGCPTGSNPSNNTMTGATVIASSNNGGSSSSDLLLLEFVNAVPQSYNVYYNGWNSINTSSPTGGVSIHHPAGDIKKISTISGTPTTTGWNGSGLSSHWNTNWSATTNGHGVTEGGSSGSPLFNGNGLIIGTLTGGASFCTSPNAPDQYGKFSYHWNSNGTANNRRIDIHLDPVGNGSATSLGGVYFPCSVATSDDAGISTINEPGTELCGTSFTPEVVLRNFGSNNLTSVTINYQVNGGAIQTFNWTGNLAQNSIINVTLPAQSAINGNNTFTAYTSNPNGNADGNASNNSSSVSFVATVANALPYSQGFQGGAFPPVGLSIQNPDNGDTWERTTDYGAYGTSTACAIVDLWNYDNSQGELDWLITDAYDFSAATSGSLTFDYAYSFYDGPAGILTDTLGIAYTVDCGENWFGYLWQEGGADLSTVGPNGQQPVFVPGANDWETVTVDLTQFAGESSLQLAFICISGWGNTLALDNINLTAAAAPTPPVADFSANTTSLCDGGSISFTDQSTGTPTSWQWTFTGGTPTSSTMQNPTVNYASPGNYSVTLVATNADGTDTETKTNYITVNSNPTVSLSETPVDCFGGNNGSITATPSGNGGFSYSWTGSNSTSATASNLTAGNYSVTVTDANQCTVTASTSITQPATAISINTVVNNAQCGQASGSIVATATGGTPGYMYSYSAGPNNLAPGNYTITATDANGCSSTASFSIVNEDIPFTVNVTTTPSGCGIASGTASATVNGGTAGYTFQWSSGTSGNTVSNLAFGNYTVTATNAQGCTETASFDITNLNAPVIGGISVTPASCNGAMDGTATVIASGGTPSYTYDIGNGPQGSNVFNALSAGNYNVTVMDASSCVATGSFTITEPTAVTLGLNGVDEHCDQADGSIIATAAGGDGNFTYTYNGNAGSANQQNLTANTYVVVATDGNGCSAMGSVTLNNEAAPVISNVVVNDVSCFGAQDGAINIDVTGGSGALTYDWSNTSNMQDLVNVSGDTYTLIVSDAFGCTSTITETIDEPTSAVAIDLNVVDNVIAGGVSSVTALVTGGLQPYTYDWNNGESTQTITDLGTGLYIVTVTDANGCSAMDTASVGPVAIPTLDAIETLKLYPNPTSGFIALEMEFGKTVAIEVAIFNALGQVMKQKEINSFKKGEVVFDMSDASNGVYFVRISTDGQQRIVKFSKTDR